MRTLPAAGVTSMQAVVQDRYGSAEVLRTETVARPTPGEDEVLVQVRAAGVDRGVWHLMTGRPHLVRVAVGLRRPRNPVPGGDLAGVVVAVGAAVTRFAVGDEVYGFGRGTFAEYAVARADKLAPKPPVLSFEQAAAVPVSAVTALQALSIGRISAGQRVLVLGASGGVGSFAVQIAKVRGAEVTGVASSAKLDLVRAIGADHVLDHTSADFADAAGAYDLILDIGGNPSLGRLRRALTPTGTAVIVGGEHGGSWTGGMHRTLAARLLSLVLRQRLTSLIASPRAADLEELADLLQDGSVVPLLDSTRPLAQAAEALASLEAGGVRGKCVLTV